MGSGRDNMQKERRDLKKRRQEQQMEKKEGLRPKRVRPDGVRENERTAGAESSAQLDFCVRMFWEEQRN